MKIIKRSIVVVVALLAVVAVWRFVRPKATSTVDRAGPRQSGQLPRAPAQMQEQAASQALSISRTDRTSKTDEAPQVETAPSVRSVQPPAVTAELVPASVSVVSPTAAETAATRRMYGAHAPLRTPAVADPDSAENRRILQDMVTKALARANQPQSSTSK